MKCRWRDQKQKKTNMNRKWFEMCFMLHLLIVLSQMTHSKWITREIKNGATEKKHDMLLPEINFCLQWIFSI